MKTTDEYLKDFLDKKNELSEKGELWRLRVTQEEFVSEIERIRAYEIEHKKSSNLNNYHIQKNIEEMIYVLLMNTTTAEEMKKQADWLKNEIDEELVKKKNIRNHN